jgi:SAM-dependent methyltransferase
VTVGLAKWGQQVVEASGYVMGGGLSERARLLRQCDELRHEASWLLDQLPAADGGRALDIGCGPLGILDLLAEHVGPQGQVIGLEHEPRFVDMATSIVRERRLANVLVVQGDARACELASDYFDVVHERLVLLQQPDPAIVLSEMVRLAKPGGVVAVEDIDTASWFCEPAHAAWDELRGLFETFVAGTGMDTRLGRRLPALLRDAGLVDVEAQVHTGVCPIGDSRRFLLLSLVAPVQDLLVESGLISSDELNKLIVATQDHLSNPATLVVRQLHVQSWGRKPS